MAITGADSKQNLGHWQFNREGKLHWNNIRNDTSVIRLTTSYKNINIAFTVYLDVANEV